MTQNSAATPFVEDIPWNRLGCCTQRARADGKETKRKCPLCVYLQQFPICCVCMRVAFVYLDLIFFTTRRAWFPPETHLCMLVCGRGRERSFEYYYFFVLMASPFNYYYYFFSLHCPISLVILDTAVVLLQIVYILCMS